MSESDSDDCCRLTLSPPGSHSHSDRSNSSKQPPHNEEPERGPRRSQRRSTDRSTSSMAKEEHIPAPYPWSTDRRAVVQSLDRLMENGIMTIYGEVNCKKCDGTQMLEIDLQASFYQLSRYFLTNRNIMHDRAPMVWYSPRLLDCNMCLQGDCVRPIICAKKRSINWLFLQLTQTLGLCTLEQLKYFCKHNRKHRTGAKDRVLYLTYVGLLKQLDPSGPYD